MKSTWNKGNAILLGSAIAFSTMAQATDRLSYEFKTLNATPDIQTGPTADTWRWPASLNDDGILMTNIRESLPNGDKLFSTNFFDTNTNNYVSNTDINQVRGLDFSGDYYLATEYNFGQITGQNHICEFSGTHPESCSPIADETFNNFIPSQSRMTGNNIGRSINSEGWVAVTGNKNGSDSDSLIISPEGSLVFSADRDIPYSSAYRPQISWVANGTYPIVAGQIAVTINGSTVFRPFILTHDGQQYNAHFASPSLNLDGYSALAVNSNGDLVLTPTYATRAAMKHCSLDLAALTAGSDFTCLQTPGVIQETAGKFLSKWMLSEDGIFVVSGINNIPTDYRAFSLFVDLNSTPYVAKPLIELLPTDQGFDDPDWELSAMAASSTGDVYIAGLRISDHPGYPQPTADGKIYSFLLTPNTIKDTDSDSIEDSLDNCPLIANADQADLDLDGLGDACDSDIDGDNWDNIQDCAPQDMAINPAAQETPYSGVDENCNGIEDDSAEGAVDNVISIIQQLPTDSFSKPKHAKSLIKKLNRIQNKINSTLALTGQKKKQRKLQKQINKIQNKLLTKTDGCTVTGSPKKNDWITDCDAQTEVYDALQSLINWIENLKAQ